MKEPRTYVVGDIHGSYLALEQCLKRCKFRNKKDTLICLGDVCDGFPQTAEVVERLLKIKNLICIEGNHDSWCRNWLAYGGTPQIWTSQGGDKTIQSYMENQDLMEKHLDFFDDMNRLYEDDKKRLFVHGGFPIGSDPKKEPLNELTWNRDLWYNRNNKFSIKPYSEVFVGHSSTWGISHHPFCRNNVWFLDQGAGWEGVLSIMDVDTHEFWQSDKSFDLYYNH